jgi:hypothetical protein
VLELQEKLPKGNVFPVYEKQDKNSKGNLLNFFLNVFLSTKGVVKYNLDILSNN